jgi:fatty-acyl-CoA synthase
MSTQKAFVYITGRASDMYISGGSNIYPREVEEKILTHPAIGEVAGARRARPVLGRSRRCRLRRARGGCRGERSRAGGVPFAKVSRYKMPKRFFFWEALPKSGYGKIPKRLVRDELEARGLLDLTKDAPQ